MRRMLDGKTLLITGGTGSFGQSFIKYILKYDNPFKVIVFSRDEMKQWKMSHDYVKEERVRFFIGDVRDKERLYRALQGVDYVVHAAATKIVPIAEYNPFECIKTNIHGAMNLIEACIDSKVKAVVALSTDKASAPYNLYGATKLASDKLFTASNGSYAGGRDCKMSVVRYGNVMGSRGSVIPLFLQMKETGRITVTNKEMTRYMMPIQEAVEMVMTAFRNMNGGEIFVKKMKSVNIYQLAKLIGPKCEVEITGIRPGEKLHEQMISTEDASFTFEFDNFYKIVSNLDHNLKNVDLLTGTKVHDTFSYTSNNNPEWWGESELISWIRDNKNKFLAI